MDLRAWRQERAAARAEARTAAALRREREHAWSAERRAARTAAEARRHSGFAGHAGSQPGGPG